MRRHAIEKCRYITAILTDADVAAAGKEEIESLHQLHLYFTDVADAIAFCHTAQLYESCTSFLLIRILLAGLLMYQGNEHSDAWLNIYPCDFFPLTRKMVTMYISYAKSKENDWKMHGAKEKHDDKLMNITEDEVSSLFGIQQSFAYFLFFR